jgi:hypothetical protein
MTIRIYSPSPAGNNTSRSNTDRQTTPAAVGSLFSALKSGDSSSIQKALTEIDITYNKGSSGLAQHSETVQGSERNSFNTAAQRTTPYAPLTIKSIYGEPPAGLDRSGLSGIIDKSGHNLSNEEIANFFDGNPSSADIAEMGLSLGLNQYQQARAIAIWRGTTYVEPVWVPNGASTIGGTAGGEITGNSLPTAASGAWGNNSTSVQNGFTDTISLASADPTRRLTA